MPKKRNRRRRVAFDDRSTDANRPSDQNKFDRDRGWIMVILAAVLIICAVTSGYGTFSGIRLFMLQAGDVE